MRMASIIRIPDPTGVPPILASELRASFVMRGGATVMDGRYHTAPMKIAKSFPLRGGKGGSGGGLGVIVMDVSPGMLEGDRYTLDWSAGADTRVVLTNQSFTKVHPCTGGGRAELLQRYALDQSAVVEAMFEPVMLYRDADLTADTEVRLSEGAVWMGTEVLCPGRMLHGEGETFRFRRHDSRLRVYGSGGELIFHQRQKTVPAGRQLSLPGAWEVFTHTGTFYAFGDSVGRVQLDAARDALGGLPMRAERQVLAGASLTYRDGLVVMAAGGAAWTVREALTCAWKAVRASLDGDVPNEAAPAFGF